MLPHPWNDVVAGVDSPHQVDGYTRGPVLKARPYGQGRRIVHENVDTPQRLFRCFQESPQGFRISDIAGRSIDFDASVEQLTLCFSQRLLPAGTDSYVCPLRRQAKCNGPTDSAASTEDDTVVPFQFQIHSLR